jgi:hypothetical protein
MDILPAALDLARMRASKGWRMSERRNCDPNLAQHASCEQCVVGWRAHEEERTKGVVIFRSHPDMRYPSSSSSIG